MLTSSSGDPLTVGSGLDSVSDLEEMTCLMDFLLTKRSSNRSANQETVQEASSSAWEFTRLAYHVERVGIAASGEEVAWTLSETQQQIDPQSLFSYTPASQVL